MFLICELLFKRGIKCLGSFFVWLHHFLNMAFKVIRLVDVNPKVDDGRVLCWA